MYEIVSDMSTRQDTFEDRIATMEDKLANLQEQLDLLPDLIASRIQAQVRFFLLYSAHLIIFFLGRKNGAAAEFFTS